MSKEIYGIALRNALTEIGNVCPDIQASFLFDKEANVVAGDAETPEETIEKVANSLEGILNKADTIGGLNSLIIEGSKGNVHLSSVNDLYLTLIASKTADMKYVETVARVLIPTVMKLLDSLGPTPLRQLPPSHILLEPEKEQEEAEDTEKLEEDNEITEVETLPDLDLPSNQLIVESFGGLLTRSDTVQLSEEVLSQWEEFLDGKKISHVLVEAFNGQSNEWKVKGLNESKLGNKAIIRIPEKICQNLDIKKGELVRVKPVIT
ncbi:roadblock/LC7 domain-containing protein [Candidatus Bathyarchaeota archaeon]|nr:roadblock/LC7 domain-containing protein [Candidatus Bathyarchaeota archaeon]